jgi:hypothetical protein
MKPEEPRKDGDETTTEEVIDAMSEDAETKESADGESEGIRSLREANKQKAQQLKELQQKKIATAAKMAELEALKDKILSARIKWQELKVQLKEMKKAKQENMQVNMEEMKAKIAEAKAEFKEAFEQWKLQLQTFNLQYS